MTPCLRRAINEQLKSRLRDSVKGCAEIVYCTTQHRNKMKVGKALFTLLLVAFLVADSVVKGLLSEKLETDGKWEKSSINLYLQRACRQPVSRLFFISFPLRFAQTNCFKFLLQTDQFSMFYFFPACQLFNGCFSYVFTVFVQVVADRNH